MTKGKPIVAIDWDHTLVEGKEFKPGAKEAIGTLREKGYYVIIHSCNNKDWIENTLNNAGVVVDYVCSNDDGKPACALYVDDRGYRFEGDWGAALVDILALLEDKDG